MRTTLTLDQDVVLLVQREMHERRLPMKDVINGALRLALAGPPFAAEAAGDYVVPVHHAVLAPGVDPAGFNRTADDLEDLALIERARRPRP